MPESGFYPPGAEHDPRAPWNQPDAVECPDCGGTGQIAGPDEFGNYDACDRCEGAGVIDPRELEDEGPDPDDLRDAELDRRMNGE